MLAARQAAEQRFDEAAVRSLELAPPERQGWLAEVAALLGASAHHQHHPRNEPRYAQLCALLGEQVDPRCAHIAAGGAARRAAEAGPSAVEEDGEDGLHAAPTTGASSEEAASCWDDRPTCPRCRRKVRNGWFSRFHGGADRDVVVCIRCAANIQLLDAASVAVLRSVELAARIGTPIWVITAVVGLYQMNETFGAADPFGARFEALVGQLIQWVFFPIAAWRVARVANTRIGRRSVRAVVASILALAMSVRVATTLATGAAPAEFGFPRALISAPEAFPIPAELASSTADPVGNAADAQPFQIGDLMIGRLDRVAAGPEEVTLCPDPKHFARGTIGVIAVIPPAPDSRPDCHTMLLGRHEWIHYPPERQYGSKQPPIRATFRARSILDDAPAYDDVEATWSVRDWKVTLRSTEADGTPDGRYDLQASAAVLVAQRGHTELSIAVNAERGDETVRARLARAARDVVVRSVEVRSSVLDALYYFSIATLVLTAWRTILAWLAARARVADLLSSFAAGGGS